MPENSDDYRIYREVRFISGIVIYKAISEF